MTAGWGSIAQIDVEILLAVGTVMRRGGHQEVNRATGASIAQVVQGALVRGVARGEMATSWTGGVLMVSAIQSQLGYWEVLDVDNALGGVWHVFTRSKHRGLPWEKMVGTGSIKVITCPVHIESRISATVSEYQGITYIQVLPNSAPRVVAQPQEEAFRRRQGAPGHQSRAGQTRPE